MNHQQFRELHDYCQTLSPKIGRNSIINKIKLVSGTERLRTIKTTLDTKVTRGYFLSVSNTEHPFVKDNGYDATRNRGSSRPVKARGKGLRAVSSGERHFGTPWC